MIFAEYFLPWLCLILVIASAIEGFRPFEPYSAMTISAWILCLADSAVVIAHRHLL